MDKKVYTNNFKEIIYFAFFNNLSLHTTIKLFIFAISKDKQ